MVAYITKIRGGFYQLTVCARPCSGAEYQAGEKVIVPGKREANAYCRERGIQPYNF
jgi:hypothetical protein